jgi:hypothetical protein
MTRVVTRMRRVMLLAAALALPACGGDEATGTAAADQAKAAPPQKKAAATGRPAGPGGRRGRDRSGRLDTYAHIDERFRLPFGERDFASDPGGDENRDPFRSYVIRQGGSPDLKGVVPIQPTDVCTERNSRAPGHAIRDLRLIGLVLRGTRSYAQFRDPSGFGWIVRLRDCLGKEKAIVEKIGAGFVTLELVPEVASTKEPQAERRDIQLHPAELRAEEETPAEAPRPVAAPPRPASQP